MHKMMFTKHLDYLEWATPDDMKYIDVTKWANRMVLLFHYGGEGKDAKADLEWVKFKEHLVTSLKDDLSKIPLAMAWEKCLKYVDDFVNDNNKDDSL